MVFQWGRRIPRDFLRNERGAVLFAANVVLPLLLGAGVALDYTRANLGRAELQAALDGSALAIAEAEGLSDDIRIAIGNRYFKSSFGELSFAGSIATRFSIKSDRVVAEATVKVPTSLMSLAGFPSIDIGGLSEVMRPVKDGAAIAAVPE
jgi:Flp pilus assembly protein TadG